MQYNAKDTTTPQVDVTRAALFQAAATAVKLQRLNELVAEVVDLVLAKNADYGNAWQRYGIFTPLIRINDKTLRLATLADGRQAMVANEAITDTLRDIIGYSLLALIWLEENTTMIKFQLPTDDTSESVSGGKLVQLSFVSDPANNLSNDPLDGLTPEARASIIAIYKALKIENDE